MADLAFPAPGHRALAFAAIVLALAFAVTNAWATRLPAEHPASVCTRLAWSGACHQRPERCLSLGGRSLPACARCTGLQASALVGGLLLLAPWPRRWLVTARPAWLAAGLVPLLADVGAGVLVPGWDHAWLRLLTGLLAGTAVLASVRLLPHSVSS